MNVKPALLVTALAATALISVGCEQRSADSGTSPSAQSSGTSPSSDQTAANPAAGQQGQMAANPAAGQQGQMAANPMPGQQAAGAPDDAALTAKVKAAMLAEPGLKSVQIGVDTKDATVTLTGNVESDMLRDRAKQIAMSTEGVKNVVDNLNVKPS